MADHNHGLDYKSTALIAKGCIFSSYFFIVFGCEANVSLNFNLPYVITGVPIIEYVRTYSKI